MAQFDLFAGSNKFSKTNKITEKCFITWSRKLRVTLPDKQASMHAPRFVTQS